MGKHILYGWGCFQFLFISNINQFDRRIITIYNKSTKNHTKLLAVKSMDVRENFKEWCNKVISGETLIVSRPKNENVVIVSEKEYNEMAKARRNAEYLAMLDRSYKQLENGESISFSMEELQAMESDDWEPTEKVLNWMERMKHKDE